MVDLSHISTEELRDALAEVESKEPTQRLTAAIAHKNGVTQTELAEWYGVQRKTIYNWLTRFGAATGSESLATAARDDPRPGRPRRVTDDQLAKLEERLHAPPEEAGYDAPAWTPALVKQYLEECWGVEYSTSHCRTLLKESGLSHQTPRRENAEADPEEREEFQDELQKNASNGTEQ